MTKYTICICDDEANFRKILRQFILQYSFSYNTDIDIMEVDSAEKLLKCQLHYDILFLDIKFGTNNIGIDIAENLRLHGNTSIIVLITSFAAMSIDGYRAEPFRFILKPIKEEIITNLLHECFCKLNRTVTYLKITNDFVSEMIRADKIIYIYSKFRKRHIVCVGKKTIQTWQSLNELINNLPSSKFTYSQKSFIVNLDMVDTIINDKIALTNGMIVPLGLHFKNTFMKALEVNIHE